MIIQQFYSELGKLLYAVADIDGKISKKEKKALHELVRKKLVPAENSIDEYGTDAAFYAEFEFDILDETLQEPQAAFESFINFIENHKTAIDKRMLLATRKVAEKLADVYHHTSKKEKHLIDELNKKLDSLIAEKNRVLK